MGKSIADVLALISENNVEMINFKMADAKGEYHQVTIPASSFSIDLIQNGINIDTTTYTCVAANKCDAIFIPDIDTVVLDQGSLISTVVIAGELRYFNNKSTPVSLEVSKNAEKNARIFGIVAILCGLAGLLLLSLEFVLGCFAVLCCLVSYAGWDVAVLGVIPIALVNFVADILALVCGIVGIVFGTLSIKKCKIAGHSAGMGVAGLILGIVATLIWSLPVIFTILTAILCAIIITVIVAFYLAIIVMYLLILVLAAVFYV